MSSKKWFKPTQHGPVYAKKFLGQHFLNDEHTARKISKTLDFNTVNRVLEIGPGTGVMTKYLLQETDNLSVMEVDRDSVAFLKQEFSKEHAAVINDNFSIIEADFLKFDLDLLFPGQEFAIIGNFPYNISSQILFKTIENRHRIPQFSGMFQKEVAQRICEQPGSKTYGILSVLTQAFYEADYLFTVPPSVFLPPPKVHSGVLQLKRKKMYHLDCHEDLFFKVVKQAFQQRRKTLRNSLKSFGLSQEIKSKSIFNKRPEQLSTSAFIRLTNLIEQ